MHGVVLIFDEDVVDGSLLIGHGGLRRLNSESRIVGRLKEPVHRFVENGEGDELPVDFLERQPLDEQVVEHVRVDQDDVDLQLKQLIDDEIERAIRSKSQSARLI